MTFCVVKVSEVKVLVLQWNVLLLIVIRSSVGKKHITAVATQGRASLNNIIYIFMDSNVGAGPLHKVTYPSSQKIYEKPLLYRNMFIFWTVL